MHCTRYYLKRYNLRWKDQLKRGFCGVFNSISSNIAGIRLVLDTSSKNMLLNQRNGHRLILVTTFVPFFCDVHHRLTVSLLPEVFPSFLRFTCPGLTCFFFLFLFLERVSQGDVSYIGNENTQRTIGQEIDARKGKTPEHDNSIFVVSVKLYFNC